MKKDEKRELEKILEIKVFMLEKSITNLKLLKEQFDKFLEYQIEEMRHEINTIKNIISAKHEREKG